MHVRLRRRFAALAALAAAATVLAATPAASAPIGPTDPPAINATGGGARQIIQTVTPTTRQYLKITAPTAATRGRAFYITGAVTPARGKVLVYLQTRTTTGTWKTLGQTRTGSLGKYSFSTRAMTGIAATYRTYTPISGKYKAATSATKTVKLRTNAVISVKRATTVTYTNAQVLAVSASTAVHTIRIASTAPVPKVGGTVLVPPRTGAPDGLIDLVTAVTRVSNGWKLTTKTGTLAGAFADLTVTQRIVGGFGTSTADTGSGVSSPTVVPGTRTLAAPTFTCSVGKTPTTFTASLDLSDVVTDVVLDVKSKKFSANISGPIRATAKVTAGDKIECSLDWPVIERTVARIWYVPVILEVGPTLSFSSSGVASVNFNATSKVNAAVNIASTGASGTATAATSIGVPTVTLEAGVNASVLAGMKARVSLAKLPGVNFTAGYKVTPEMITGKVPDPCVRWDGAVNLGVDASIRALGLDWSYGVWDRDFFKKQLYTTCTEPPTFTPDPSPGVPDVIYRASGPAGVQPAFKGMSCPTPPSGGLIVMRMLSPLAPGLGWYWPGLRATEPIAGAVIGSTSVAPGTYTAHITCAVLPGETMATITQDKALSAASYSDYPFNITITRGALTANVAGQAVPGQFVTVSGESCEPLGVQWVTVEADDGSVVSASASTAAASGAWSPIQVQVAANASSGAHSVDVFCWNPDDPYNLSRVYFDPVVLNVTAA